MTSPTNPVAWVSAADLERVSEFGFVHAEITQRSRTDKVPLYTADQLQAARLEGIEAGIEAAGRLCDKLADNEPTGYVGDKLAIATMRVCAAYVHALALQPETVLKEYGK